MWCDLGSWSRTVVIRLRRTSALQAPIQTTAQIMIVFNACDSTCRCGMGTVKQAPAPAPLHPLLPVCQRYLSLPSRTWPHDQLLLVVGIQFLGLVRQPNFPRCPRISRAPLLLRRLLGGQNRCHCPYFRICKLMRGRDFQLPLRYLKIYIALK